MELDSGSGDGQVIGRHVADQLGLDPSLKAGQYLSATLDGGVALKSRALVDDLIVDGNIGLLPVLSRWVVTFDLGQGRLWIADASPASGSSP